MVGVKAAASHDAGHSLKPRDLLQTAYEAVTNDTSIQAGGSTASLAIVDGEGNLGDADNAKRIKAVENHYKWVEAAKYLECATIRVNAYGVGSAEDVAVAAVDGLGCCVRARLECLRKPQCHLISSNHWQTRCDARYGGQGVGVGLYFAAGQFAWERQVREIERVNSDEASRRR